jgi:HSP20 family molecular chaperone IbpA
MITNYETYKEAAKENGITSGDARVIFTKLVKVAQVECNDYFNELVDNYINARWDNVGEVLLDIYHHQLNLTYEFKVKHLYKVNQELIRIKSVWRYEIDKKDKCVKCIYVGTLRDMAMWSSTNGVTATHIGGYSTETILQAIKEKPLSHNKNTLPHKSSYGDAMNAIDDIVNESKKDENVAMTISPKGKSYIYEEFETHMKEVRDMYRNSGKPVVTATQIKDYVIIGDAFINGLKPVIWDDACTKALNSFKLNNKQINTETDIPNELKANMQWNKLNAHLYKDTNILTKLNKDRNMVNKLYTDTIMSNMSNMLNKEVTMSNILNITLKPELAKFTATANVPGLDADDLNFVVDTETNQITVEVVETGECSNIQLASKFEAENATVTVDKGVLTIVATPKKGRMQVLKANVKAKTPTDSKKKTKEN